MPGAVRPASVLAQGHYSSDEEACHAEGHVGHNFFYSLREIFYDE